MASYAKGLTTSPFQVQIRYIKKASPWVIVLHQDSYSRTVALPFEKNGFVSKLITNADYCVVPHSGRTLFQIAGHMGTELESTQVETALLQVVEELLPHSRILERRWSAIRGDLKQHHLFSKDRFCAV